MITKRPSATNPYEELENTGYFYGRPFYIDERVLIPRPETEQIIEQVLNKLAPKGAEPQLTATRLSKDGERVSDESRNDGHEERRGSNVVAEAPGVISILDLGTGSGAIAITLALELPRAKITASDISQDALAVAKINQEKLAPNSKIHFVQSDLLQNFCNKQSSSADAKFDIIAANLPYVDKNWTWLDRAALAHEPEIALFAKDSGLELMKKLIRQAPDCLTENGILILELDPCQAPHMKNYANEHGFDIAHERPFCLTLRQRNRKTAR